MIIALFNMSGGVGKSTLTMNLGYHLSADFKKKVLLIDADPQASLTTFMGLSPFDLEQTLYHTLIEKKPLPVVHGLNECDLVPSNIFLSQAELQLASAMRREYKLSDALTSVKSYDVTLIDSPPSLGLLSINSLVAADYLLIPIQTEYKSVEATINLLKLTMDLAKEVNPTLLVAGAIPTMYDDRKSQSRRALETITELFSSLQKMKTFKKAKVFPRIPDRTDFANAAADHKPLALFAPKNEAVSVLSQIAAELKDLK